MSDFNEEIKNMSADLMEKCASDPAEAVRFMRFQMAKYDYKLEDCRSFYKLANEKIGDRSKEAGIASNIYSAAKKNLKNLSANPAVQIAAGLMAASAAMKGVEAINTKIQSRKAFNAILKEDPNLAKDPNMEGYLNTIVSFAPKVSRDKNVLRTALQHAHEYGRMEYPLVKDLVQLQTGLIKSESDRDGMPVNLANVAKTVSGFAG